MLYAAADEFTVWLPEGGGDRVTTVHVDCGLCAVLSAAFLGGAAMLVGESAHAVWFISLFVCLHDNLSHGSMLK